MSTQAIVCDSSVIRGMSNDPRNICYHYRHHLTGKQVYHCEISYREVVDGLLRDHQLSRESATTYFIDWIDEFRSEPLPQTRLGEKKGEEIQKRLSRLEGLITEKTANASKHDCLIAGETIARGITELAAHDRDFLFIEIVSDNMLRVLMLEMPPGEHPRQKRLSNQHKQRLLERLKAV